MNNKGFAVTGMLYILLLIFVSMFITILAMFANRLNIYEKIKDEIMMGNVNVKSISFENDNLTVLINATVQLVAIIEPENATDTSLVWTSSNERVATVSDSGLVTGVSKGTAIITATTSNNKSATATITVTGGPTKVAATSGQTHKGIVYLDPTDLSKSCNASNSVSTTNTKSGCMKWYIYDDSGNNYKMILDHNAIARVQWYSLTSNIGYANSNAKQAMDATLTNWKVTPSFISAEEISTITGITGWTSTSSWYYLDTKTQTAVATSSAKSKYDWLYNNTYNCFYSGCTVEDSNGRYELYGDSSNRGYTEGYWTSTTYGDPWSGSDVWNVRRDSTLFYNNATENAYGIRPVITISKSQLS